MMNLNQLADNIENDVEIKVVADPAADKAAVKELQEQISSTDGVLEVVYSIKGQELNKMIHSFGMNSLFINRVIRLVTPCT